MAMNRRTHEIEQDSIIGAFKDFLETEET
ncbi:hypothetical protein M218_23375 [Burkholderia pseudomallei MSHR338]|nr:hypothetical protein M218_23375 [Burkholderia pseudomallei MSHR338]